MIGYLRGECLEVSNHQLLLGVSGGDAVIGYSVQVPARLGYSDVAVGAQASFWIYTHVREDQLDLFGFLSRAEKEFFLTLMSVNGIGPKLALQILSSAEPALILEAILAGDKDFLVDLPGVGDKTAARMILELKKKLSKMVDDGVFQRAPTARASASSATVVHSAVGMLGEARQALVGLGFKEAEITRVLENAIKGDAVSKTEDLIRVALKELR